MMWRVRFRLQVEGQTDAEGVERFLQIDAHAVRRRRRAGRGRAAGAGAGGGQAEGLGVLAEIRPAVLRPPLPAGEELLFPARTDRAADPRVVPGHRRRWHCGWTMVRWTR